MKKQVLLLIALVSCVNAYALPTMPTVDLQAYKQALTTTIANKNTTTAVFATAFAAVFFYAIYQAYVNGFTGDSAFVATEKEEESDYMKYGTSFPTPEQRRAANKELLPVVAVVAPAAPAQEVAPVATQDQSALDKQDAYWEKFTERQMDILS